MRSRVTYVAQIGRCNVFCPNGLRIIGPISSPRKRPARGGADVVSGFVADVYDRFPPKDTRANTVALGRLWVVSCCMITTYEPAEIVAYVLCRKLLLHNELQPPAGRFSGRTSHFCSHTPGKSRPMRPRFSALRAGQLPGRSVCDTSFQRATSLQRNAYQCMALLASQQVRELATRLLEDGHVISTVSGMSMSVEKSERSGASHRSAFG